VRKVFFAVPAHTGDATCGTLTSIVQSIATLQSLGLDFELQAWVGDSLLPHARNVLIAKFMASDCTDLVMIDADLAWGMDALMALLKAPVELVAGVYRFKNDNERYPIRYLDGAQALEVTDDIAEVAEVPLGFARINRAGVERMIEAHKRRTYRHSSAPDLICHLLFDLEYREFADGEMHNGVYGDYWGEDYVFCNKFREAGGRVYIIDPEIELTHIGKKSYTGSLGGYLRKRQEPPDMIPRSDVLKLFTPERYDKLLSAAAGEHWSDHPVNPRDAQCA
jgi:hypothetical protein